MKSLKKKKGGKVGLKTSEQIIYDPTREKECLPKKSSSEEKQKTEAIRAKMKKRQSTRGEVISFHFNKIGQKNAFNSFLETKFHANSLLPRKLLKPILTQATQQFDRNNNLKKQP